MRVWRDAPNFIRYYCARCSEKGYACQFGHNGFANTDEVRRKRAEAKAEGIAYEEAQRRKANWLWENARPATGTIVEDYLAARGIRGPIPPTLKFLEPRKDEHHPAMIAPFVVPAEPAPGVLQVDAADVTSVHLTLLRADGSGKADVKRNKLMIGSVSGRPIVLAPPNDLGGLFISEGIEDGLSAGSCTGLGVWVAGSGSHLPALADTVPPYVDCVTISVDDDKAGRDGAAELAARLRARNLNVATLENIKLRNAA